jgi:hypothetical protein
MFVLRHKFIITISKNLYIIGGVVLTAVLRIRIHGIHMFLGLLDPDPLVRGMDPDLDPSNIKQK